MTLDHLILLTEEKDMWTEKAISVKRISTLQLRFLVARKEAFDAKTHTDSQRHTAGTEGSLTMTSVITTSVVELAGTGMMMLSGPSPDTS